MDSDDKINLGLIYTKPDALAWTFGGGESPITGQVLQPDGNWEAYLPVVEFQNNWGYDRMACVTYSLLNCLEILNIRLTGKEKNYSDRFLAVISGTTHNGNTLDGVYDGLRREGVCLESQYPDDAVTWEEYYKRITDDIIILAKDFFKDYTPYREWVPDWQGADVIINALKQAPLQVIVCYDSGDGILNPTGAYNHAVTLYNFKYGEYWCIYDHYTQTRKRYAWNYEFGSILKLTLIPTDMKYTFKQNQAYVLVQGNEQKVGLYIDGVVNGKTVKGLLIGEKIDVLINSSARLKKEYLITPIPLTLEAFDSVNHYDMRGNIIE